MQHDRNELATTETSKKHMSQVLNLKMSDVMDLANDGIVDSELFDKLYYHLLDNTKLRKILDEEQEDDQVYWCWLWHKNH